MQDGEHRNQVRAVIDVVVDRVAVAGRQDAADIVFVLLAAAERVITEPVDRSAYVCANVLASGRLKRREIVDDAADIGERIARVLNPHRPKRR
jgi:hypothetical protein